MRWPIVLLALISVASADTVMLKNGLSVHGKVVETKDAVEVSSNGRTWRFDRAKVREIRLGESLPEEYARRKGELGASDAEGWFRLALWARERKLPQAREAYERVVGINSDHRAARRELGYERVGERWVKGDEAKRSKGFVLCGGKWMLPEEADRLMRAGLMKQAEAIMMEAQPYIPIYYYVSKQLVSPKIEGWIDNAPDRHLTRWLDIKE